MSAVRHGRLDALEVLFDRHHRPLFGYLRGWTGDFDLAEDATQETFVRVLRYRGSYRPGSPFLPWMLQIARNIVRSRRPGPATTTIENAAAAISNDDPHQDLERNERRAHVMAALQQLPADHRELLLLSHVEELPREEIAALLGISVNAAKVRIHRALSALRERVPGAETSEDH